MPEAQANGAAASAIDNPLEESRERRLAGLQRRLHRDSASAVLLESARAGVECDPATLAAATRFLRRPRSANERELRAIAAALELQPEGSLSHEPLYSSVCALAAMPDDRDDPGLVVRYSVGLGLAGATIATLSMRGLSPADFVGVLLGVTVLLSVLATVPALFITECVVRKRVSRVRTGARAAACRRPSPIALDALLKGYMNTRRQQRVEAWWALKFQMERAEEHYYAAAPPTTVPGLIRLLHIRKSPAQIPVLNALTLFGDGRAVPEVERVLKSRPDAEVAAAAETALAVLLSRRNEEQSYGTLLRAGQAPSNAHTLVRAAAGAPVQPQELMRPAEPAADSGNSPSFEFK